MALSTQSLRGNPTGDDLRKQQAELAIKIDQQAAGEVLARRQTIVREIDEIRSQETAGADVEREAIANVKSAMIDLEASKKLLSRIQADRLSASLQREGQLQPLRTELLASAPAEIQARMDALNKAAERVRAETKTSMSSTAVFSNVQSADAFCDGARLAISKIADLKTQALDDKELAAAIGRIEKEIPPFDATLQERKR